MGSGEFTQSVAILLNCVSHRFSYRVVERLVKRAKKKEGNIHLKGTKTKNYLSNLNKWLASLTLDKYINL